MPLITYIGYNTAIKKYELKLAGMDMEPYCMADLDKNGAVNFRDFAIFSAHPPTQSVLPDDPNSISDIDHSSIVDSNDTNILMHYWLWTKNAE